MPTWRHPFSHLHGAGRLDKQRLHAVVKQVHFAHDLAADHFDATARRRHAFGRVSTCGRERMTAKFSATATGKPTFSAEYSNYTAQKMASISKAATRCGGKGRKPGYKRKTLKVRIKCCWVRRSPLRTTALPRPVALPARFVRYAARVSSCAAQGQPRDVVQLPAANPSCAPASEWRSRHLPVVMFVTPTTRTSNTRMGAAALSACSLVAVAQARLPSPPSPP